MGFYQFNVRICLYLHVWFLNPMNFLLNEGMYYNPSYWICVKVPKDTFLLLDGNSDGRVGLGRTFTGSDQIWLSFFEPIN